MRIILFKDEEGNKTRVFRAQRADGWWKSAAKLVCIAHPGVARSMRAGRVAALFAEALPLLWPEADEETLRRLN